MANCNEVTIATTVCVDPDDVGRDSFYPQLGVLAPDHRRLAYWRTATVLFCSALRCVPNCRLRLYTNDTSPAYSHGVNIHRFLQGRGVEIKLIPFEGYRPPASLAGDFRNTFYKFTALKALSESSRDGAWILLDSDCVWQRVEPRLEELLTTEKLLVYSPYEGCDPSLDNSPFTSAQMGAVFRRIDPDYPEALPVHFGGEFLAGRFDTLRAYCDKLKAAWQEVLQIDPAELAFDSGKTLFDGEEGVLCYVLNRDKSRLDTPTDLIRRIWTSESHNTVGFRDSAYAVWHLLAEKRRGLDILFREAISPDSLFWRLPIEEFGAYVGGTVGVPRRMRDNLFGLRCRVRLRIHPPLGKVKRGIRRVLSAARGKIG